MSVAKNVIIIWPSTNASIPANFVRDTRLDGLFMKGIPNNATDPNVSGGAATHSHTSPTHTHTMVSHTHSGTLSTTGTYSDSTPNTTDAQIMHGSHSHIFNSDPQSGGDVADALSYGSVSNNPPYYSVIFIKSSFSQQVPSGAIVFGATTTVPIGFSQCNGAGGTPDLRNLYLQGAGTGADAGGSGGSYTNVHDISHSHTPTSHTHTATSDSQNFSNRHDRTINHSTTQTALWPHSHSITLNGATQTLNAFSGSLTTAETVEPLYQKLMPLKNTSGIANIFIGMVCMWLESLATIPPGWRICDGGGGTPNMCAYHLKCTNSPSEVTNTGGSNTHTHAAQAHALTANGTHTHSGGSVSAHAANDLLTGNGSAPADPNQNHSISSVSSVTPTYNNANTTADNANNEPQYLTVAFIQYQSEISGAGIMAIL